MAEVSNTKRIAKNTLMLYFRQILIMAVSLYTVRVVLNVLGAEDYGIYNVVAGVVTMFGFLSGAMATASQRYLSYDLGKNDIVSLKNSFKVIITIFLLLVFLIVILSESLGLLFVCKKLIISSERYFAALVVYHISIISFVFTLITIPYMGCIIAHEEMGIYAYISIVEVVLKLISVFLLKLLLFDKLIVYGLLSMGTTAITSLLYRVYCRIHYPECKFGIAWSREKTWQIMGFIGWNFFGAGARVLKNQFLAILINQFCGPIVNAARTISLQINTALSSFSQNFSMSLRPQIVKSYASDDMGLMINLIIKGCRLTYFLMYIFILPLILEMNFVLKLWLGNFPEYTIIFSKLILIDTLIDAFSYPIQSAFQATGKIKLQQIIVGSLILLNIPISYLFLKLDFLIPIIYLIAIILTIIAFFARLVLLSKQLPCFKIFEFFSKDIFPCSVVTFISIVLSLTIKNSVKDFFSSIIMILVTVMITALLIFFFGITRSERNVLVSIIRRRIVK